MRLRSLVPHTLLVLGSSSWVHPAQAGHGSSIEPNHLQPSTGWWTHPLKSHWNGRKTGWPLSKCCATILRGIGDPARTPVISRSAVHTWLYPGGFLVGSNICSCHVCTLHTFTIEASIWNKSSHKKVYSCSCVSETAFWRTCLQLIMGTSITPRNSPVY